MYYQVQQRGQVLGTFPLFMDAWFFAALDNDSYSIIIDSDGYKWVVNPLSHDIN